MHKKCVCFVLQMVSGFSRAVTSGVKWLVKDMLFRGPLGFLSKSIEFYQARIKLQLLTEHQPR